MEKLFPFFRASRCNREEKARKMWSETFIIWLVTVATKASHLRQHQAGVKLAGEGEETFAIFLVREEIQNKNGTKEIASCFLISTACLHHHDTFDTSLTSLSGNFPLVLSLSCNYFSIISQLFLLQSTELKVDPDRTFIQFADGIKSHCLPMERRKRCLSTSQTVFLRLFPFLIPNRGSCVHHLESHSIWLLSYKQSYKFCFLFSW